MGMVVRSNLMAYNANRQLGMNNSSLSKSLEKLASGFKINRAGDDASGLAISEKMKAQIKGLETASANAQDGISLVQTAEGALTEVHSMLNRMVELATKSANGTMQNEVDREALQSELESLRSEINRISESANFNGINLLDGSLAGTGSAGGLTGGKIATYEAAVSATLTGTDLSAAGAITYTDKDTLIVDGVEVTVDWSVLSAEDKAALEIEWDSNADMEVAGKAADVIEKTINGAIAKANADKGTNVADVKVSALTGAKTFTIASGLKDSGASQIKFASVGTKSVLKGIGAAADTGAGKMAVATFTGDAGKLNDAFTMTLDGEEYAIDLTGAGLTSGADAASIIAALNNGITATLGKYADAKGMTAAEKTAFQASVKASLNNKGQIEFINTSGLKIGFDDKGDSDAAALLGISTQGKAILGGGLTLQIGDTADEFNMVTVSVEDMSTKGLGIDNISVADEKKAAKAVDVVKSAINVVSTNRANLGALQNRLEHTINNLDVTAENMTSANSRVVDTDMAKQMMQYTQMNVLTQAAQAMLAQANQQPQSVLQLLQ